MAAILKCIFLNENVWISITIWLKFVPRGAMACHQPGNKPLFEPMMVSLLMHKCVIWPQCIYQASTRNHYMWSLRLFPMTKIANIFMFLLKHSALKGLIWGQKGPVKEVPLVALEMRCWWGPRPTWTGHCHITDGSPLLMAHQSKPLIQPIVSQLSLLPANQTGCNINWSPHPNPKM